MQRLALLTLTLNLKFQINIHKCIHHRSGNVLLKFRDPILLESPDRVFGQDLSNKQKNPTKIQNDTASTTSQVSSNHRRVDAILHLKLPGCSHTCRQHREYKATFNRFFSTFKLIFQYLNKAPLFSNFLYLKINSTSQRHPR